MPLSRRKFVKNLSVSAIAVGGVLTFLKKCTDLFDPRVKIDLSKFVQCAFRLTDHHSLLNLEYYFINCDYHADKVWAKYGPAENYMIVRLPQQHIAEQFSETGVGFAAATVISGYSYLVFRILFPKDGFIRSMFTGKDGRYSYIDLTQKDLLKWDDETRFRLVVRQDLTESLFELTTVESLNQPDSLIDQHVKIQDQKFILKSLAPASRDSLQPIIDSAQKKYAQDLSVYQQAHRENRYPFQTVKKDSNYVFNVDLIPKAYGDPVTAIELPWRLIISPRLPDSARFKFKWSIPDTDLGDKKQKTGVKKAKMWTTSLSITERDDEDYQNKLKSEKNKSEEDRSEGSLNDIINRMELMILGSPDYPAPNGAYNDILPAGMDRKDLVALYIKLRIVARTEKLTFSAVGATATIHLKNEKIEQAFKLPPPIGPLALIEWNQIISMGRDQKVEVSTLFLEAEFGHKMAYIRIAERELVEGAYPLILKEYIVPLDITKDYSNHITQGATSRFNAPFKKIKFLETKPKLLVMEGKYDQKGLNQTQTVFEFEAIDWQDNIIHFTKQINALPFGAAVQKDANGHLLVPIEVAQIIAPDNNVNPPLVALPVVDSIPIYPVSELNTKLSEKDSTVIKAGWIDKDLKKQKDLQDSLSTLVTAAGIKSPTVIVDVLHERILEFVEIYKNKIDDLYKAGEKSFIEIKTLITDELNNKKVIVEALIQKKLISSTSPFSQLLDYWINEKMKVFNSVETFVDWIKNEKSYSDFAIIKKGVEDNLRLTKLFDNVNTDLSKNKPVAYEIEKLIEDDELKRILNNWKIEFSKKGRDIAELSLIIENADKYSFFVYLRINSPELQNAINTIAAIQKLADADMTKVLDNIRERIQLIYQIEETAKTIPGLILLKKQKIGYAIREKFDDTRDALVATLAEKTGEVKKSLSELESEYIIFKGGLRADENKIFDFFHEYAIIPQLQQAQVYVGALNKLVGQDLPIGIKYASDYYMNQVRDLEFEVNQNAAMVFGEVLEHSREQVKGLIQKLGDKMPGINVEIPAHFLTYARNPRELEADTISMLRKQLGPAAVEHIEEYSKDLIFISDEVKQAVKVMDDLRNADPKKYFKGLEAKLFGSIALEDILDLGFDIPRLTQLPDKIIYQVSTDKFKDFKAAFVVFKPSVKPGPPTRLELFLSKSLKNLQEFYSFIELNNFNVGVVIGGTDVLTVTVDRFKITSSSNQPKKTDISITDVKLGGPLEFIADLAKKFMAPGNGMRIKPGPKNLLVDYTIVLPNIMAPAFNFRNLQIVIGVNIPYDPSSLKAISFIFGVNKPEDKFLVSAGTYGGRGHFMLRATPKGIEQIDIGIELGAYGIIDLGIGQGEVFLFFGFWFVCGKDDDGENLIKAVAYVICCGSATVLGFITIGVSVLISLTYIKKGQAALFYGEAIVTYSVKIAFFKKEFTIRYHKEITGSSQGNNTTSMQSGMVLLQAGVLEMGGTGKEESANKNDFTDVFRDPSALEEYLDCFA